jgi:glycolate oxidase FAD binding subunit
MHAGRPTDAAHELSLADDTGIVEYVPGDLTLTARAGTPLSDIERATREHGQWLPLEPWGADSGSLGATISTATSGPYAHAMGLPRDVVLGVEFVTGAGQVVRAGGRVVKNVAGFDLTRLVVGAWGTLGVITEVTVRLRARPAFTRSLSLTVKRSAGDLNVLATTLRALPFTPLACEVVSTSVGRRLGIGDSGAQLLVRVGGNRRSVEAQTDALRSLAHLTEVPDDVWTSMRALEVNAPAIWRWSQLPSGFGDTWTAAEAASRSLSEVCLHGSAMRGVVRVVVSAATDEAAAAIAQAATHFAGTVAIDVLPRASWNHVTQRPASDGLSRSLRATFDPASILNPGILGSDA